MHYSMKDMPMLKNQVNRLLTILIDDFKFRVEASYDESDSDKWSTFHNQLIKMRNTIKNGLPQTCNQIPSR